MNTMPCGRKLIWSLSAAACLMTSGANALFVEVDLTAGDGFITQDTVSGLEWLDLTATQGLSWNAAEASSFVTADGFRHATIAEVEALFLNAGFLTVNNVNNPANDPAAALLLSLMGCTQFCGTVNATGRGFADFNGSFTVRPNYHTSGLGAGAATISLFSANLDLVDLTAGHFLVRESIVEMPEASVLSLIGLGLVGLMLGVRRP